MMASLCLTALKFIFSVILRSSCCIVQLSSILRSDRIFAMAMTGGGAPKEGQQHQQEKGSAPGEEGKCSSRAPPWLAGHQHS